MGKQLPRHRQAAGARHHEPGGQGAPRAGPLGAGRTATSPRPTTPPPHRQARRPSSTPGRTRSSAPSAAAAWSGRAAATRAATAARTPGVVQRFSPRARFDFEHASTACAPAGVACARREHKPNVSPAAEAQLVLASSPRSRARRAEMVEAIATARLRRPFQTSVPRRREQQGLLERGSRSCAIASSVRYPSTKKRSAPKMVRRRGNQGRRHATMSSKTARRSTSRFSTWRRLSHSPLGEALLGAKVGDQMRSVAAPQVSRARRSPRSAARALGGGSRLPTSRREVWSVSMGRGDDVDRAHVRPRRGRRWARHLGRDPRNRPRERQHRVGCPDRRARQGRGSSTNGFRSSRPS